MNPAKLCMILMVFILGCAYTVRQAQQTTVFSIRMLDHVAAMVVTLDNANIKGVDPDKIAVAARSIRLARSSLFALNSLLRLYEQQHNRAAIIRQAAESLQCLKQVVTDLEALGIEVPEDIHRAINQLDNLMRFFRTFQP